jgi:mannosyltransferase OCH1-like enzyme
VNLDIQENKTIFQICINLNDDAEGLQNSRKQLLSLNPSWNYFCIESEDQFNQIMIDNFKNSKDQFDQKIYEAFATIPKVLRVGGKAQKQPNEEKKQYIHNICKLVSQTDVFRLAMIYKFGGLYLDLSSSFVLDIDSNFSQFDCCFMKSSEEIRTSILYAKKHHPLVKTILEFVFDNIFVNETWNQYSLAGPGAWTKVIKKIDNQGAIKDNIKIFNEEKCSWWIMFPDWKQQLHTQSKKNPSKKINSHWLKEY